MAADRTYIINLLRALDTELSRTVWNVVVVDSDDSDDSGGDMAEVAFFVDGEDEDPLYSIELNRGLWKSAVESGVK